MALGVGTAGPELDADGKPTGKRARSRSTATAWKRWSPRATSTSC